MAKTIICGSCTFENIELRNVCEICGGVLSKSEQHPPNARKRRKQQTEDAELQLAVYMSLSELGHPPQAPPPPLQQQQQQQQKQ